MVKLLFLDLDGVVNSTAFMLTLFGQGICPDDRIDPQAIARVNKITDATGALIVVTSTWRLTKSFEDLRDCLVGHGISGEIIGMTPDFSGSHNRGGEILFFIDQMESEVESVVILDDDHVDLMNHRLVKTNFEKGLQECHVTQAIELFTK